MKRMLINATQPEELRVALVDGQSLFDLDVEVPSKEQKKANIYKGRISRVEPSLEACFVEYGAERHGFLPLREIAPAYHRTEAAAHEKLSVKDAVREGQEVIVQVEKEERGTKGAALTTYVSLAGRYLVLMPNNPRAGGVSRRIEGEDREDIREILAELPIPEGMGVIVRTAGVGRGLEQLKWDLDYLARVWDAIVKAAEARPAPFLVYQESNVIIRALRDHFTSDIGEVLVDDPDVVDEARTFMEMVMPQQLPKLKRYEDKVPLFTRFQIESQIDAAYQRQVRLPSGGALVFDTAEALVAIDVNSARATQGSDINETAFNTNLEAADEVARQLRLRDIGGLVVVDFIDMGSSRHTREVEQRLLKALEIDRARIQVGRISRFGLLEMSRQRLRPSLGEAVLERCPRCEGRGMIRSVESLSISVLRLMQEESIKERTSRVVAEVPVAVATYLMNEKRVALNDIESRCGVSLLLIPNPHLDTPGFRIERLREDQLGESAKPSYQRVEAPASETPPPAPARSAAPAVRAVTPLAPPPAPAVPRRGWLGRLFAALAGEAKQPPQATRRVEPAPHSEKARAERPAGRRRPAAAKAPQGRRPAGRSSGPRREGARHGAERNRSGTPAEPAPRAPATRERDQREQGAEAEAAAPARTRTRRGRRGGRRRRGARPAAAAHPTQSEPTGGAARSGEADQERLPAAVSAPRPPAAERAEPVRPPQALLAPADETPRLAALYAREESAGGAEGKGGGGED